MGLLSWITGGGRDSSKPRPDAQLSAPESAGRDPEPWVVAALTGDQPEDPMKQLPVIQPHAATSEPPPEPPSTELRTAGLVNDAARHAALEPAILATIRTVFDPEIPVNIYDLGLIYEVIVDAANVVGVRMTLTAPNCPAAQWLPGQVEDKVRRLDGVSDVKVDVVFEPPWDKDKMSDAAKLQLGMW